MQREEEERKGERGERELAEVMGEMIEEKENKPSVEVPRRKLKKTRTANTKDDNISTEELANGQKQERRRRQQRDIDRKLKLDNARADREMKKAHETAVTIARQRSRKRILRRCLYNIAIFITTEGEKLRNIKRELFTKKRARVKKVVFREWGAWAKKRLVSRREFECVRERRMLNGVFSRWIEHFHDQMMLMDKFHRAARWRQLSRCVKNWKLFCKRARNGREEAASLRVKQRSASQSKKAEKWYERTILGKVVVNWSTAVKLEVDKRKFEECQNGRKDRAKMLLARIEKKNMKQVSDDCDGVGKSDDNHDGKKDDNNDGRIAALQSLIDTCLEHRSQSDQDKEFDDRIAAAKSILEGNSSSSSNGAVGGSELQLPPPPTNSDVSTISHSTQVGSETSLSD